MTTALPSASAALCVPAALDERLKQIFDANQVTGGDGVEELQAVVADFPEHESRILGHIAWGLAQRGEHERAMEIYRRLIEISPSDTEAKWRIGDRYVNLGRLEEAETSYRAALSDHPGCSDAKMGLRYVQYLRRTSHRETTPYVPHQKEMTDLQRQNKELNNREFNEGKTSLDSTPISLFLESTTKCNFYCKTCSKGYGPYHAEDLHDDILQQVQRDIMPSNIRISITGFGEPTMANSFDRILKMALDNGSFVHFVTNGSFLNFERLEGLTRCSALITISMDGATKETFESIRAGSNFDLILDKLAMVKKLRDIHLSSFFSSFVFHFVALRKNIHELPDLIRLARHFGINRVAVADYAFGDMDFDNQSLRYEPDKGNQYFKESRRVAAELQVKLIVPPDYVAHPPPPPGASVWGKARNVRRVFSEPGRFAGRCSSPWREPYIYTDGVVTPCCSSAQYLGSLKRSDFSQIWNGWRYRFLRFRIHSALPPAYCRSCFVPWGINRGNPGNVMSREGLLVKAFYFLEWRFHRLWENTVERISNRRARANSTTNFYHGKPITAKNNRITSPKSQA